MNDQSTIAYLRRLIHDHERLDPPAVSLLEPEVRTGDKFLLRDPFAGTAASKGPGAKAQDRVRSNRSVGALVMEWGYDVRPENLDAFLHFLDTNEIDLFESSPQNCKYRGTYSVFSSTEKGTGHFRTIWSYREFGDLTALSDEYEKSSVFSSLVKKLKSFADDSAGAARSQQIYLLASSSRPTNR